MPATDGGSVTTYTLTRAMMPEAGRRRRAPCRGGNHGWENFFPLAGARPTAYAAGVTAEGPYASRILIVDDEAANVLLLQRLLEAEGYRAITTTTDPRRVLDLYRSAQPDLILLDLMMPHMDGVAVLQQLHGEIPAGAYVPVLVLTADATLEARRRALAAGAHDFLTKPFEQFEALLRIRNLLDTRRLYVALEQHNRSLEDTVRQRTERLMQSEKLATMGSL